MEHHPGEENSEEQSDGESSMRRPSNQEEEGNAEGGEAEGGTGNGKEEVSGEHTDTGSDKRQRERPMWIKPRKAVMVSDKVLEVVGGNYEKVYEAFLALDINGDGRLSKRELKTGFEVMDFAQSLSEQDINQIMAIADADSNGFIDLHEFLRSFGPHPLTKDDILLGLYNLGNTPKGRRPAYLSFKWQNAMVHSIDALADYVHLQFVDVSHNLLSDLAPLGRLQHMVSINVSHNRLESVLDFRPPANLKYADCSHNNIHSINDLSAHRSLHTLDLSNNFISSITGVSQNLLLRKLVLDDNRILQITGLNKLQIQHLSIRNNRLSAINGHALMGPDVVELQAALEANFDLLEDAFVLMDANEDGRVSRKELRNGLLCLNLIPHLDAKDSPTDMSEFVDKKLGLLMDHLDRNHDGTIDPREFSALFNKTDPELENDSGIRTLVELETLDLSGNSISSLKGLEGHPRLRVIKMADTAVKDLSELEYMAHLQLLEELDLTGAPIASPSKSPAEASCFRIKAINCLLPKNGKTKLTILNHVMVVAEERVASANFHNANHLQYYDTRRDDAQDLPPVLFQ